VRIKFKPFVETRGANFPVPACPGLTRHAMLEVAAVDETRHSACSEIGGTADGRGFKQRVETKSRRP